MQVNNHEFYEDLTPESTVKIIDDFRNGVQVKIGPQIDRNYAEGPEGRTCLRLHEYTPEDSSYHDRDFVAAKEDWERAKAAQAQAKK